MNKEMSAAPVIRLIHSIPVKRERRKKRIESIDLLRGVVMLLMALDHVRGYFHYDAFYYNPTDLTQTNVPLFLTRFITHYCAPVFVFLAGISAFLNGTKRSKRELSVYLFTRGLWLVFAELFIIILGRTFNPAYPMINLQVIWAIGIAMIVLSAMIHLKNHWILLSAVLLISGHNLLDRVHINGTGSFLWSLLHEPNRFTAGNFTIFVAYPILPWLGILTFGYWFGYLYQPRYKESKRRKALIITGSAFVALFLLLRASNLYGDSSHWAVQEKAAFTLLSFFNVTKYPPSLLYSLITLGPAMIFLAFAEKPLNSLSSKIAVIGRVPFFYYVVHIYVIHLLAVAAAVMTGFHWTSMILTKHINNEESLKGYGFNLITVYNIWIALIFILYPFCEWFDHYKRKHQSKKRWLTYL
ncbi:MAG TPA: heparan-alpha-glucosaminide N-acetyltransferase domain-containing protein [Chitinophagaceae bacterium]